MARKWKKAQHYNSGPGPGLFLALYGPRRVIESH